MVDKAISIWEDGPSSNSTEPIKSKLRQWGTWLEAMITAGALGDNWKATQALLNADLAHAADSVAVVYDDPIAANIGFYVKIGASGSGSWSQIASFLPGYQFVTATDAGAGTANAIVATCSPAVSYISGAQLITLNIYETNTGPATVAFDGGSLLTIKTSSGSDVASGYLTAGNIVVGVIMGSTFRLLSDVSGAVYQAAAEAAADRAEAAAASIDFHSVASLDDINAVDPDDHKTVFAKDDSGGLLFWTSADMSGSLLCAAAYTPSSIDAGADTLTFSFVQSTIPGTISSGMNVPLKGFPLYCTNANSNTDFTAGTIYWVWRSVTNYTDIKLCPTFADAIAGTNFIDLTDTTHMPSFKVHRDPVQGMVRIPTGLALDGSAGGFRRLSLAGNVHPEWFGATPWDAISDPDSGYGLQMAMHWSRTSFDTAYGSYVDGRLQFFKSTISLNHTGLQNGFSMMKDIRILAACAGKIALDIAGANTAFFQNVFIISSNAGVDVPSYHIVSTRANNGNHTAPIPSAASNGGQNIVCYGDALYASYLNLNSDLSRIYNGKFYNTYRGVARTTCSVMHAAVYQTVSNYIGSAVSDYQEIIDASDVFSTNTGTTLDHIYDIEARRPADYILAVDHVTKSGTVLILHMNASDTGTSFFTDNGINNLDPVNLLPNVTFGANFPRNDYTLNNINYTNDTAEVWLASGASAFDATSVVTGDFTSMRVVNNTGPAVIIGGGSRGVTMRGYGLAYSATNILLDVQDGDINRLDLQMVHENGQTYTTSIIPHASTARLITEWTMRCMGDLSGPGGNIRKAAGGNVTLKNFVYRDAYKQSGTALLTTARLFVGTTTQLTLENFDISCSSSFLLNSFNSTTFNGRPTGKVYNAETGLITYYPQGTYTPTYKATTSTNIDDTTTLAGTSIQFHQMGNRVRVRGSLTIDPTLGSSTSTAVSMTLPVASNMTNVSDLTGMAIRYNSASEMIYITADTTNDVAVFTFISSGTTPFNAIFEFEYIVK